VPNLVRVLRYAFFKLPFGDNHEVFVMPECENHENPNIRRTLANLRRLKLKPTRSHYLRRIFFTGVIASRKLHLEPHRFALALFAGHKKVYATVL
jgi:hypothetical protein